MTVAVRTLQNILQLPGTTSPWANRVITIRLNCSAFADSGQIEKLKDLYVTTDATGLWAAVLEVNAALDPAGTSYSVREATGLVWPAVVVPAGDPTVPVWLRDCLVDDPTNPNQLTPGIAGVAATNSPTGVGDVFAVTSLDPAEGAWSPGGGDAVASVTAGDGTVTVGGTDNDPTVKVTPGTFDTFGSATTALSSAESYTDGKISTEVTARNAAIAVETARAEGVEAAKADLVSGKVPTAQMPSLALVTAVGVANQAGMLALTTSQVQPGDLAVRADGAGTFILVSADPSQLSSWLLLNAPSDLVSSVNGHLGTVVLAASDVGAASTAQLASEVARAESAEALLSPLVSPHLTGNPLSNGLPIAVQTVFDPRTFGAKFDGTTDDSAAIQSAIDAAYAAGGGVVQLAGAGTGVSNGGSSAATSIIVNSTLIEKSGVWLRGNGATTVLQGTADPIIGLAGSGATQDRMTVSDLFLQSPAGVGIKFDLSGQSGGTQLGWARIVAQNVTCADAASHAFENTGGAIEVRWINCVSIRSGGHGLYINETDNVIIGCTVANSTVDGIVVNGGNNRLASTKSYANTGNGFAVAGAGRHTLSSCEAQDNAGAGFSVTGNWNSLSSCLADSNNTAGFDIGGSNNTLSGCTAMYGGGGSGQETKVGFRFDSGARENVVAGVSGCLVPVAGDVQGNTVTVNAAVGSRAQISYAASITPDPYAGAIQAITLTGNLTIGSPVNKHVGQRLAFEFTQDGTGGRTVTFAACYSTSWTPSTTANKGNFIEFEFDGAVWRQVSEAVGLTLPAAITDSFNRANGAIGNADTGQTWQTYVPTGGASWQVIGDQAGVPGASAGNNLAWIDAGVADNTVQMTAAVDADYAAPIWRLSDANNYYMLAGNFIQKIVAGSPVSVATGVVNAGPGDTITVTTSGPTHLIYKNGSLSFMFVDSFNQTATAAGMFTSGPTDRIDNFSIL